MRSFLATALLGSVAVAQLPFVSPITANGVEGSGSNAFPFTSAVLRRYQQIHDDLPQVPLTIAGLSFRFNSPTAVTNYSGTRAIDLELYLGNGPNSYADVSRNLNANFSTPGTLAIARTVVNWGPQGLSVLPGPQAFHTNMDLPLNAPYLWLPITPTLTWETVIYGNTGSGTFATLDVDLGVTTTATASTVGAGCICTGRASAQTASVVMADMQGYLGFAIGVANGPSNAQVFSSIGFSNPNVSLPGLCSNVYTDLTFFFANGTTSAAGALANSSGFGMFLPNAFAGAQLYFQNFVVDAGLGNAIPLCAGSGVVFTVPTSNTSKIVRVSRAFDSSGTTTSNESLFFPTSILGYGLPVEFY